MRGVWVILGALALSGCVGSGGGPAAPGVARGAPSSPQSAILYRDTVTVGFSDGAQCVALRPGRAQAWDGVLQGCPYGLAYRVELPAGPGRPRRVLVRTDGGGVAVITIGAAAFGLRPGV